MRVAGVAGSTPTGLEGGDVLKRKSTKRTAFAKLEAGLEDAVAYHRDTPQLTTRDVELKPPAPMAANVTGARRVALPSTPVRR